MKTKILFLLAFLSIFSVQAQLAFSLKEAISYAVKNHTNVKNAQLDIYNADARVREIKAVGLPQVSGSLGYTKNIVVPSLFIPARTFDPTAPEGAVTAAKFGVNNSANIGVSLSQLIFDGSYLLGLKAANVYKELSVKSMKQTKEQISENVMKAYYSILVNDERIKILDLNIGRLDSTYHETKQYNEKGFVELVDVQRLEVQVNNLKTERWKVQELQKLSYDLLKFQMGLEPAEVISLKDKLSDIALQTILPSSTEVNYDDRTDYSMLLTQKHLQELDVKNLKAGYLPRVTGSGSYGYTAGQEKFSQLFSSVWPASSALGINVSIPIFDGFSKKYKIIQSQNNLQKINNNFKLLENSIHLQVSQANTMLKNGVESLNSQKRNMELAKEVVRVTKAKYQQGLGSNLEVVNAESSLKEAQTNYFTALYDVLIARVDLDKSLGKLEIE